MPSTRTLAAGVVLLVALAGCNAFAPSPSRTNTAAATAVTTASPGYPPGVNESGVTDPVALLAANERAVSNDTVRTTWTRSERYPNGTVARASGWSVHTAPGTEGYLVEGWVHGSSVGSPASRSLNVSHWSNGSVTAVRTVDGGAASYEYLRDRRSLPVDRYGQLRERLLSMETRTTGVTRSGEARVHVAGTGFRGSAGPTTYFENESLETFELSVAENGTVRSFRLAYTATRGDQLVTVVTEFRLTYAGGGPGRPPWVDTARDRASSAG